MSRRARTRPQTPQPQGCVIAFCSLFILIGLALFTWVTILPSLQVIAAGDWIETPCRITHSTVRSHSASEGSDTYSVDIHYSYEVDGLPYEGKRYNFQRGSTAGYEAKRRAVDAHPVGAERLCYVDGSDPTQAVIDRSIGDGLWFGALGLLFVAPGVLVIVFSRRSQRRERGPRAGRARKGRSVSTGSPAAGHGFLELRSKSTPLKKFIGICIACLIWNGVVSVFLFQAFGESPAAANWLIRIFMIPFVLVGLGLLAGVVHGFLALFNPTVDVTLRRSELRPGDRVEFAWEFRGRTDRIDRLTLAFIGTERATYRVGTDTKTSEHIFHEQALVELERGEDLAFGTGTIEIAEGALPTFESRHNSVEWTVKVSAEIRKWPDVERHFPVPILPHAIERGDRMSSLVLDLERDPAAFRPGEKIAFTLRWRLEYETGDDAIEVNLLWHTRGIGTEDVGIGATHREEYPGAEGERRLHMVAPEFPYSFSGKLISLEWELEAHIGKEGPTAAAGLVIAPRGEEVILE